MGTYFKVICFIIGLILLPGNAAAHAIPPFIDGSVPHLAATGDTTNYYSLGEAALREKDYPRAEAAFQTYLDRTPAGTFATPARLGLGISLYYTGKLTESREQLQTLIDLPDSETANSARYFIAQAWYEVKQYREAANEAEQLVARAEDTGIRQLGFTILIKSLAAERRDAEILRRRNFFLQGSTGPGGVELLVMLAEVEWRSGDQSRSIEFLKRAADQSRDPRRRSSLLLRIAQQEITCGEFESARHHAKLATGLPPAVDEERCWLCLRAAIYLNDDSEIVSQAEEYHRNYSAGKYRNEVAYILALVWERQGQNIKICNELEQVLGRQPNKRLRGQVLIALGRCYLRRGLITIARQRLAEAEQLGIDYLKGEIDYVSGAIALANEEWGVARTRFRAALTGGLVPREEIYYRLGSAEYGAGNLPQACDWLDSAIGIHETARPKVNGRSLAVAAHFATALDPYNLMIHAQYRQGKLATSYHYLEQTRSRSLLDQLYENVLFQSCEIDSGLLMKLNTVREQLSMLESKIAMVREKGGSSTEIEQEQQRKYRIYSSIVEEIFSLYPRYRELTDPHIATLTEVQELLDDSTVLVEYHQPGDARVQPLIFVITKTKLEVVELSRSNPTAHVDPKNYGQLLTTSLFGRQRSAAETEKLRTWGGALYARYFVPIEQYLAGKSEVIIAPADELDLIPCEILMDSAGVQLGDKYRISYIPSGSVLYYLRHHGGDTAQFQREELMALGGCWYGAQDSSLARGTAPDTFAQDELELRAEAALRSGTGLCEIYAALQQDFPPLIETRTEVETVGRVYYPATETWQRQVVTGPAASEDLIKKMNRSGELNHIRRLHFASHGVVVPGYPALSAVVLTLPERLPASEQERWGLREDGYLTMAEILNLRLDADLVVLSACETARGREMSGEGVVGLTWAFLIAGARGMVVTLWPVDDAATSAFMVRFHELLCEGCDSPSALREVKREFREETRYARWRDPCFWSGFVYYGE